MPMNSRMVTRVMAMIWDFVKSRPDDLADPGPADDGDPLDPAVRVPLRRRGGPGGRLSAASVLEPGDDLHTHAVARSRR
jgi:hypothetical protein